MSTNATIARISGAYRVQTSNAQHLQGHPGDTIMWTNNTPHTVMIRFDYDPNNDPPILVPFESPPGSGQCIQARVDRTILPGGTEPATICNVPLDRYPYRVRVFGTGGTTDAEGPISDEPLYFGRFEECIELLRDFLSEKGLSWTEGCLGLVESYLRTGVGDLGQVRECTLDLYDLLAPYKEEIPEDLRKCLRRLRALLRDIRPKIVVF